MPSDIPPTVETPQHLDPLGVLGRTGRPAQPPSPSSPSSAFGTESFAGKIAFGLGVFGKGYLKNVRLILLLSKLPGSATDLPFSFVGIQRVQLSP